MDEIQNMLLIANKLFKEKKYEEVILHLNQYNPEELIDISIRAEYYYFLAYCYNCLGRFSDSEFFINKAMEIKGLESDFYFNVQLLLGSLYKRQHNYAKAIEILNKLLVITNQDKDKIGVKLNLANCYIESQDYMMAIELLQEVIRLKKKCGDSDLSQVNHSLAIAYFYLKDYEKALEYLELAGTEIFKRDNPQEIMKFYNSRCAILVKDKRFSEAITCLSDLISLSQKYKAKFNEQTYWRNLGFVYNNIDKKSRALECYEKAINIFENIGTKYINNEDNKMSFYTYRGDLYQSAVKLCYSMELYEKAFEYSQRSKAKSFRDLYIDNLPILSVKEMQCILNQYEEDILIVDYFHDKESLYIFTIDKNHFEVTKINIEEDKIQSFYEYLKEEVLNFSVDIGEHWLTIREYIIDPIKEYIKQNRVIYFIPFGVLNYFPLQALEVDNQKIIENHVVGFCPTVALIKNWREKTKEFKSRIVYGVDCMENEETTIVDEAKEIHRILGGKLLLDKAVTKERVLETILGMDIIYFSCHGLYDKISPKESGLCLYNKELLTVEDIKFLNINADTVILSACQSALGTANNSNEIISITQAFLNSGVSTVIATLWSVDTDSTKLFMESFVKNLQTNNKITSLQIAQKELLNNERFAHTHYSSPFILIGNWQ